MMALVWRLLEYLFTYNMWLFCGLWFTDQYLIWYFQNKAKLVTYVVASGLTYGAEEHIFHYLFKVSVIFTSEIVYKVRGM